MIKIFAALLFSLPIFGSDTVFEHKFIPTIILMEKDGVKLYHVLIQIDKDFPFAGMKETLFPSISVSIRNNEDALIASFAPILNSTEIIDGFSSFEFMTSVGNAKNTELIFMKTGIAAPETKRFKLNQFGAIAKVYGKTTHIEIE